MAYYCFVFFYDIKLKSGFWTIKSRYQACDGCWLEYKNLLLASKVFNFSYLVYNHNENCIEYLTMLNSTFTEAALSATYVENYLDCVENLPNDLQRHLSRMRELDVTYRGNYCFLVYFPRLLLILNKLQPCHCIILFRIDHYFCYVDVLVSYVLHMHKQYTHCFGDNRFQNSSVFNSLWI